MRKQVIITALALTLTASLQLKAESALSMLGYGLRTRSCNTRIMGMGMASLGVRDTLGIDIRYPAMWMGPSTARFAFQTSMTRNWIEDDGGSDISDEAIFNGVSFVLPIAKKQFFGFTLSPYTRTSYKWITQRSVGDGSTKETQQGRGGVSQGIAGLSVPVSEKLRIGLAARGLFGKIERSWRIEYTDLIANAAELTNSDRLAGFGWGFSMYVADFGGWSMGAALNSPVKMSVERRSFVAKSDYALSDTTIDVGETWDLPLEISLGASRMFGRHVTAIEAQWSGWGSLEEPVTIEGDFTDAISVSCGWEWHPVFKPLDPFLKSLVYRGGFYYQQHYTRNPDGHRADKYALTGGVSIPYFDNLSRLDVALELGWMGSKDSDGVAERSIKLTVGFNHSQLWFVGRRERN